jgi:hypothetical protein
MIRQSLCIAIAAVALGMTHAGAAHAQTYPRTIDNGDSRDIDYGPGPRGNIVGGGSVSVSGSGENLAIAHHDPRFTQQPPPGLVLVSIGSGESQIVVWVPPESDRTLLALLGTGRR